MESSNCKDFQHIWPRQAFGFSDITSAKFKILLFTEVAHTEDAKRVERDEKHC